MIKRKTDKKYKNGTIIFIHNGWLDKKDNIGWEKQLCVM